MRGPRSAPLRLTPPRRGAGPAGVRRRPRAAPPLRRGGDSGRISREIAKCNRLACSGGLRLGHTSPCVNHEPAACPGGQEGRGQRGLYQEQRGQQGREASAPLCSEPAPPALCAVLSPSLPEGQKAGVGRAEGTGAAYSGAEVTEGRPHRALQLPDRRLQ